MSQTVLYQSFKYDGSLHYQAQVQLEYAHDNLVILYLPAGTTYRGKRSGAFQHDLRAYFWMDRWYNIEQTLDDDPRIGMHYYINIATPPTFDGATLSFIDLDLDLTLDNRWRVMLLDEDEFATNSVRYNYPTRVREQATQAVKQVRDAIQMRVWPFGGFMHSKNVRLRPYHWNDLTKMDRWAGTYGPFDDPWLIPFPGWERHEWFANYIETPVCRLYAIENSQKELIGHISLRDIVKGQHSRLGIGLAPSQVGHGYGTEALRAFMPYYFDVLGFERMLLDVAATNQRALRTYQKVGFRQFSQHYRSAGLESHWRILDEPRYASFRPFFQKTYWGLQQLYYDMEMTRMDFQKLKQTQPLHA